MTTEYIEEYARKELRRIKKAGVGSGIREIGDAHLTLSIMMAMKTNRPQRIIDENTGEFILIKPPRISYHPKEDIDDLECELDAMVSHMELAE